MLRLAVAAAAATSLLASTAHAQDAGPRRLGEPTDKEVAAVMPKDAKADGIQGVAVLRCRVNDRGYLESCMVESEAPADYGLGEAALKLTAKYRFVAGQAGARVRIPVILRGPERLAITEVSPDSQMRLLYPKEAKGAGLGVVRCQAGDEGRFRGCSVAAEEPADVGFGQAAMAAATDFKFGLKDSAGRDVAGRTFVLAIPFAAP